MVPALGDNDHVTPVFDEPVTDAVNGCVCEGCRITLAGVRLIDTTGAATVMDPELAVIAAPEPSRSASTGLVNGIDNTPAAAGERVTDTVATTPFPIVFAFNPVSRHIFPWQYSDLPAAVAAGPPCTVNDTAPGGMAKVHCNPAVVPVPEVKEMGRSTVEP